MTYNKAQAITLIAIIAIINSAIICGLSIIYPPAANLEISSTVSASMSISSLVL